MTAVFADTSFYVALANPRDALHARAQELAREHADAVVIITLRRPASEP